MCMCIELSMPFHKRQVFLLVMILSKLSVWVRSIEGKPCANLEELIHSRNLHARPNRTVLMWLVFVCVIYLPANRVRACAFSAGGRGALFRMFSYREIRTQIFGTRDTISQHKERQCLLSRLHMTSVLTKPPTKDRRVYRSQR